MIDTLKPTQMTRNNMIPRLTSERQQWIISLHIATLRWTQIANMPDNRKGYVAATLGGEIYVIGKYVAFLDLMWTAFTHGHIIFYLCSNEGQSFLQRSTNKIFSRK